MTASRSLDDFATAKLAALATAGLRREIADTTPLEGAWVERGGRRLLSFSGNDYLNLSSHPAVVAAAQEAVSRYGAGAGASRLVTGNHPLYAALETRLARLKGTQAAIVFGSGYLANTGIIPALIGEADLILIDELAHACLWSGAATSRAAVLTFRHNDVAQALALLAEHRTRHPHALIATDGVFSMDGDLAPLVELGHLAREHDAWLLSDDAHGIGVVGGGRGSTFAGCETADVTLQMGTFSKAVGAYGGYLCASQAVIDLMVNRARTLIYSTALPPAAVAAATASLDIITSQPDYAASPLRKAKAFTARVGLPDAQSPIVPVIVGAAEDAVTASRLLEDAGFLAVAIRPPTVPAGTARLRLSFCAAHPDDEIERLADLVRTRVMRS